MIVARWIAASVLAALALLVAAGNVYYIVLTQRTGRRHSPVPLVAALFGVTAGLRCPAPGSTALGLLFLLIDYTAPLLVVSVARGDFRA